MTRFRSFGLLSVALLVAACGGGSTPTTRPATQPPATQAPATAAPATESPATETPATEAPATEAPATEAPATEPPATEGPATEAPATPDPAGSLDPSASDGGVVARVTITGDTRGDRDGTHTIIGVADDGSYCSPDLSGPTYTALAWFDDAPNGQIHRFSITVPLEDVLQADGDVTAITDGRVSLDFISESGFGTQYDNDNSDPDHGGAGTIDVTRIGDAVAFSFRGTTWDGVAIEGQMICADAHR